MTSTAPKIGRPLALSRQRISDTLNLIAEGFSVRQACLKTNVPRETFRRAILEERSKGLTGLWGHYAQALEHQADSHRERILELAEELEEGTVDKDQIQAMRVAIDTRKWVASKLAPKVYGDYAGKGPDTVNISVEALHLTALKQLPSPDPIQDAEIIPE